MNDLRFYCLSAGGFLALLIALFTVLGNEHIFKSTLGKVAKPYQNIDG
ncbi:MAG: hypothetical protein KDD36_12490 [Flavobacteriales bacterium]|nr:hypothetical protein [Flavobacteriales bacterium]